MIGKARETPYYLTQTEIGYIKSALAMYIDYLRDGDDDDKEMSLKVLGFYSKITED